MVFQPQKMNKLPQLKAPRLRESGDGLGFGEVGVMAGQPTPPTYAPQKYGFIKALLRESKWVFISPDHKALLLRGCTLGGWLVH